MHHYSVPGYIDEAAFGLFRVSGNNEKLVGIYANCDKELAVLAYIPKIGYKARDDIVKSTILV